MLLTTKFLRPTSDPRAVRRHRLDALLEPEQSKRLNLIVAPAGFGKTTLVSQWCARNGTSTAWLSLDEFDDQPRQFWQYLVGAFKHAGLIGLDDAEKHLMRQQEGDLNHAISSLINALNDNNNPWQLVIDDYHVINTDAIHRQLAWFMDYLPPGILVTIASRTEPPLPLARWRVRRQVQDVHPGLMAFSEDECRAFFQDTMALNLSDQDIRTIFRRTEGWVAAMQLSALSGRTDALKSSQAHKDSIVAPDGKLISDYVLSEVLQQLPDTLTDFLLDTASCPRLCSSLCNALRQRDDSQDILQNLLSQNLFLIPMDNHNEWFRYHDLFREALLQRLQQIDPERGSDLQSRTINWLLSHGHVQEAIALIVKRNDNEQLAKVLAEHGNNLIHGGFHLPVLGWIESLPASRLTDSPQLQMLRIWGLFFANRLDGLDPRLTELEDLLDRRVADSHPDAEGALAIHSEISLVRSYLARSRNDDKNASDLTRQVLKDIDQIQIPLKSVTYYGLGLDYFGRGDLSAAEEALASAVHYGQIEHKASTVLSSGGLLAWIQYHRGDTDLALTTTSRVRNWVDEHYADPTQPRLISCWQNSALTEIYRERNEPELAANYLSPLLEHVENGTEPGQHVVIQYVRGHLAFSEGRLEHAIELLEDAVITGRKRREHILFEPPAASALLARCYLASGHLEKANTSLLPALETPAANPLNREQNQIALARVQVARGDLQLAQETLSVLISVAERNAHNRHLVEILLVYADALARQHRTEEANEMLERALDRAESAGFLRLFVEESRSLRDMLLDCPRLRTPGRWNRELLTMLKYQQGDNPIPEAPSRRRSANDNYNNALAEPLSQREQEVLDLINQGLANKDIATKMTVAPATVKAHIRNLYGKLGASRRTEALAKARELGLLED
ncbi:MAG: LuxR family transcriptional regulator, maltose regulon positive regulatory protein [Marinobacter excellens HL-55]|uniref:LuxR family transcriptional regulator, maltose regulon positive regulatory protein n=1 Tax=Marinobacter excellens HL-55 TaxID=1305731 RepID=A0A0P7ZDC6_9GAMM|nr:MAG: LuxR family transcriptional regulator, maltose regulon positive regulatory protein [Marinobacter excellens HL-55]